MTGAEVDVVVKIKDQAETFHVSRIFHSRNPKTNEYHVNMAYSNNGNTGWLKLYCRQEEAQELALDIKNGRVKDLSNYVVIHN